MAAVAKQSKRQKSSKRRRGPGRPFKPGQKPTHGFKPGQSGNPGGLPTTVKEIRALALSHSPDALARLVELSNHPDGMVSCRAAEGVLDRAGLRPFVAEGDKLEVTVDDGGSALGRLSALLARRLAAAGAGSGVAGVAEPALTKGS
jgi:hypothetical protein